MKAKFFSFSLYLVAFVALFGCSLGGMDGDQVAGDQAARGVSVVWQEKIYAYASNTGGGAPDNHDTLTVCKFDKSNRLIARDHYMREKGSSDWGSAYCTEKMTYLSSGLLSSIEADGILSKVGKYVFQYPFGGYPCVQYYNTNGEYIGLIIIKKKSTRTEYAFYSVDIRSTTRYTGSTIIEDVTPPSGYDRQLKLTTTNLYGIVDSLYLEYVYKKGHLEYMNYWNSKGRYKFSQYTPDTSDWANVRKCDVRNTGKTLEKKYRDLASSNYDPFDPADVFNIFHPTGTYYLYL